LRTLCRQGLNLAHFVQLQALLTYLAVLPARTTLKFGGLDVDAVMRARQRLVRAAVLSYIWGWRLSWHENAVSFATPQWSARTRSY
jgi:hypothetical protein